MMVLDWPHHAIDSTANHSSDMIPLTDTIIVNVLITSIIKVKIFAVKIFLLYSQALFHRENIVREMSTMILVTLHLAIDPLWTFTFTATFSLFVVRFTRPQGTTLLANPATGYRRS